MRIVICNKNSLKSSLIFLLAILCSCGGGGAQNNTSDGSSLQNQPTDSSQNTNLDTSLAVDEEASNKFDECSFGECKFE